MTRALVVVMLAASVAHADPPPPLEEALAKAAAAGLPLVVELGATWCGPCQRFDATVMPRDDVKAAIAGIQLVRYDIDLAPGDAVASRFGSNSVPTFLVIASDGTVLTRHTGALDAPQFIQLLAGARDHVATPEELERAVAQRPDDAAARMQLVRHYRAVGKLDRALEELAIVATSPAAPRDVAAQALAMQGDIVGARTRVATAVDEALAFLDRFPGSPLASGRLALVAVSGRVEPGRLADLAHRHLAASAPAHARDAVLAAVVAGAGSEAALFVDQLPKTPATAMLDVEVRLSRADLAGAKRVYADACRDRRAAGAALWCRAYEIVPHLPYVVEGAGVGAMRRTARGHVEALVDPAGAARNPYLGLADLDEDERAFGDSLVAALDAAERDCRRFATRHTHVYVHLVPAPAGGAARRVEILDDDDPTNLCVRGALSGARLAPASPRLADRGVHVSVAFEVRSRPREAPMKDYGVAPPHRELGILAFGSARAGEADAITAGGSVVADVVATSAVTVTLAGHVEVGPSTVVYRGLAGIGVPLRDEVRLTLLAGFGGSEIGDAVPYSSEIPVVALLRAGDGRVRIHAWLEASRLVGKSMRHGPREGDLLTPDEGAFTLGASVKVGHQRVFAGVSLEERRDGKSGVFLVGMPLLGFY